MLLGYVSIPLRSKHQDESSGNFQKYDGKLRIIEEGIQTPHFAKRVEIGEEKN
jgi:hypothetical protein